MWEITGVLGITLVCAVIEWPRLKASRRDRWVFAVLLGGVSVLSAAFVLKVSLPNPLDWIAAVFQPFVS